VCGKSLLIDEKIIINKIKKAMKSWRMVYVECLPKKKKVKGGGGASVLFPVPLEGTLLGKLQTSFTM